ncbi:MAG: DUF4363 family protein [Oscillospiraceae bacterium]|nr:DUF4363 family protein [Oscillospiraceae bacterium]
MKYFWIPAAVLALLLGASLWNAAAMDAAVTPWRAALTDAQDAAARGNWDGAARIVRETREAWEAKHAYFHIVTAHDELDAADELFAAAEGFAAERDEPEFRVAAAQLDVQLRVVAEMQRLTVKNVL